MLTREKFIKANLLLYCIKLTVGSPEVA